MSRRVVQRRINKKCRTSISLSQRAVKKPQKRCSKREEVYAALQYAASFHCLVEEWKDCEELKPKPKERWIFVDKKRGNGTPNGMVCSGRQVSMYEVWNK